MVSLRFGAQSGHAVEGYLVSRIGGSSGIERDVHQCVSYQSQSRQVLGEKRGNVPDVASKVLTSSEAETAWRVVGTVEPL